MKPGSPSRQAAATAQLTAAAALAPAAGRIATPPPPSLLQLLAQQHQPPQAPPQHPSMVAASGGGDGPDEARGVWAQAEVPLLASAVCAHGDAGPACLLACAQPSAYALCLLDIVIKSQPAPETRA